MEGCILLRTVYVKYLSESPSFRTLHGMQANNLNLSTVQIH